MPNADLTNALSRSLRTVASVNTPRAAGQCIEQGTAWWIENHLRQPWSIYTIDLTLITYSVRATDADHIKQTGHGIFSPNTFPYFNDPNPALWVYSTDSYTEAWVHELVLKLAQTDPDQNRILNVQRDDKGPLIDLT